MRGDVQVRFGGRYRKTYCRKAVRRSVPSLRLGKGAVSLNWLHTCMLQTMAPSTAGADCRNRHHCMYTRYLSLLANARLFRSEGFQQLEWYRYRLLPCFPYLQGRNKSGTGKENVVKPVTPTMANGTLPSPSQQVPGGFEVATLFQPASPCRKFPSGSLKARTASLRYVFEGFHGLPFLSDIETGELPKLSGVGRAGLHCIELRIECKQGSLSVGQLRTHPRFLTTTMQEWKHSGKSAWNTAEPVHPGRRRFKRIQGLWMNTCRNRLKEKGSSSPPKGAQPITGKEERLPVIAHYNYTLRFRSCGLSRGD